jgi:glycosyltransferase involved in cell wall biosynthesis
MTQKLPITIVMPGYNAEHLIGASLGSLAGQSMLPSEVIVIDDCSTDATVAAAEQFSSVLPLRVIRLTTNQGPGEARRLAVLEASQPWISALDADDVALPNHLETLWNLCAEGRDHSVVAIPRLISWTPATSVDVTPPIQLPIARAQLIESIARKNIIPVASLFSRAQAIASGNYSPRRQAEDMELWLRMLLDGANFKVASAPTFVYRRSVVSNSTNILQLTEASLSAVRLARDHGLRVGAPSDQIQALDHAESFRIAEVFWHEMGQKGRSESGIRGLLRAARSSPSLSLKEASRLVRTRAQRLMR